MENAPLVTVVITTYNQEHTIARAIDSVLAQKTDFPFEIYITDDGSRDGTQALLLRYAARWPHKIKLNLRQHTVGISLNWYEALCKAQGSYLCILAGNDWWLTTGKLQSQMDFLREHPEYTAVGHPLLLQDSENNLQCESPCDPSIRGKITIDTFLQGHFFPFTSCLFENFISPADTNQKKYITANRNTAGFSMCLLMLDHGDVFIADEAYTAHDIHSMGKSDGNFFISSSSTGKYSEFLDMTAASSAYFGSKYNLNHCILNRSAEVFADSLRHGGTAQFFRQSSRLSQKQQLQLPIALLRNALRKIKFGGITHG